MSRVSTEYVSIAAASVGQDGNATDNPGACAKYASFDSLWCSTARMPPPTGTLITRLSAISSFQRAVIRAAWVMIWFIPG